MDSPSSSSTTDKGRILFVTLGCAKNEVDTDRMRARLLAAGYAEAEDVAGADAAIVNTCSFLVAATEESIECTLALAAEAAEGVRELPIVMAGCVPSRYGDDVAAEMSEVARFVPAEQEDGIVEVIDELLGNVTAGSAPAVLRTVSGASAFIKISEGCDRFCSFCAIPYIRGPYWSRPAAEILAEIRALAEQGVREFVLIGQDTGVWGCDFDEPDTLASLLARAADAVAPYKGWVRVLYLQPEGMTDELIAVIRDRAEVLPYIDMPVQHCSADVLERMGREGSEPELTALIARLRREIPGMVIRTTAMAGFPGETDAEAAELEAFLEDNAFDYCSVFAFSAEEGTRAAELDGQVPEEVKLERTQALMDIAERLGFAATAVHVGETVDVIVDGIEEGPDGPELIGHAWFQAPDSDGAIHIASGEAAVGDIVSCELVDSFCYELIGEIR